MTMKKTDTNSNETYRMTIGETEIYGVSIQQLTDLHETIGTFIQREKAPFKYKTKSSDEYCIDIIKTITLESGEEDFSVEYSLDSFDIDMDCMSAKQMKRAANMMLKFLEKYEEDGNKKITWDTNDYPPETLGGINFEIQKDNRLSLFETTPCVTKYIKQGDFYKAKITYEIDVNEMKSRDLSLKEFIMLYRKLGDFLNDR